MKVRILIITIFCAIVGSLIFSYAQEHLERAPAAPSTELLTKGQPASRAPVHASAELLKELTKTDKEIISLVNAIIAAEVETNGRAISASLRQRAEDKSIFYIVKIEKKPFSLEMVEVDVIKGNIIKKRPFFENPGIPAKAQPTKVQP